MDLRDINKLIQDTGLSLDDVAAVLYPENKYPRMALKRLMDGNSKLSIDQYKKLTGGGGDVSNFYWKGMVEREGLISIESSEWKATIDKGLNVILYKKGTLKRSFLITDCKALTVVEFIKEIEKAISNLK